MRKEDSVPQLHIVLKPIGRLALSALQLLHTESARDAQTLIYSSMTGPQEVCVRKRQSDFDPPPDFCTYHVTKRVCVQGQVVQSGSYQVRFKQDLSYHDTSLA